MNRETFITIAVILMVAFGPGAQADEECIFTSPDASSPLDVYDGAIYRDVGIFGYFLVLPPSSELMYAAESNEEDPYPCLLGAATVFMHPYLLYIDVNSPIRIDIVAAARRRTSWLPWPCSQRRVCLAFGGSTVAAVAPDINDLDVAYFAARYVFATIVLR